VGLGTIGHLDTIYPFSAALTFQWIPIRSTKRAFVPWSGSNPSLFPFHSFPYYLTLVVSFMMYESWIRIASFILLFILALPVDCLAKKERRLQERLRIPATTLPLQLLV
jgi:hypothetical protein